MKVSGQTEAMIYPDREMLQMLKSVLPVFADLVETDATEKLNQSVSLLFLSEPFL